MTEHCLEDRNARLSRHHRADPRRLGGGVAVATEENPVWDARGNGRAGSRAACL